MLEQDKFEDPSRGDFWYGHLGPIKGAAIMIMGATNTYRQEPS